ncbi:MAG: hypothetical protein B7733_04685 [Myxococcales bacterium FL481]|nr:MAG: hypothetical protein B7733_04685 [Myxococcales bacterium FL481]
MNEVVELHLSPEELFVYVAGLGSAEEDRRVEEHVRRCAVCRARLAAEAQRSTQFVEAAAMDGERSSVAWRDSSAQEEPSWSWRGASRKLLHQAAGWSAVACLLLLPMVRHELGSSPRRVSHPVRVASASALAVCEEEEANICEDTIGDLVFSEDPSVGVEPSLARPRSGDLQCFVDERGGTGLEPEPTAMCLLSSAGDG